MYIWGGRSSSTTYVNTGARYNINNDTWQEIPTDDAPSARAEFVMVPVTEMSHLLLLFGGRNYSSYFNDMYALIPTYWGSVAWVQYNKPNPPSARAGAEGTWIGTGNTGYLYIWGGYLGRMHWI